MTDGSRFRSGNWQSLLLELVVVIVGVIIALGVDSWWEERQERQSERQHLVELEAEFTENIRRLDQTIHAIETNMSAARSLIGVLEDSRPRPDDEELMQLTWDAFGFPVYNPLFSAYDNLVSTGEIRLIRNDMLKRNLAAFRANFDSLQNRDWVLDQWQSLIQPWVVDHLQLDWMPTEYRQQWRLPDPKLRTDWDAVLADQRFRGIIMSRFIAWTDYMNGIEELLPTASAIATELGIEE